MTKRVSIPVQILDPSELIGRNLGPLALINPLLEKMDIRRIVNQHCPPDKRLEVSVGEVIHALVANRLCSPEPLYQVGQWAEYSGAEFLLGVPASALNDDRLGRALDVVFAKRWTILADMALHVSASFHVSLAKVHYDPTSFHFTGDYDETSDNPSFCPEVAPFKIEVGRHARPGDDIKEAQVGVNLANDGRGPVPFFYHSVDGSSNGHSAVAKNLQHLLKYVKPKRLMMITDRGCFSSEYAISMVRKHKFDFISSVTWTDELVQLYEQYKQEMKQASFLSMKEKQKRRLDTSQETWERYCIGEIPYRISYIKKPEAKNKDTAKGKNKKVKVSMRARLIFVHSTADMKVCRKTRAKYTAKIKQGLQDIQHSVDNGYQKETDAVIKKVEALYGKKQARNYFTYQVRELTSKELKSLPARRKGQRWPKLTFSYQYHQELAKRDAQYDGLYAISTSLPKKTHNTDEVFTAFKEQHHIETAHHQWKAPIRLRPLFLKKVTRIESLILVQFLALMAFYLLQRRYRLAKGVSCRTTAETLLKRFAFLAIGLHYNEQSVQVTPLPLIQSQEAIFRTLRLPCIPDQIKPLVTQPDQP